MVTITEAQEQIVQREEQLAQARGEIEAYRTVPEMTRAELMKATPLTQARFRELTERRLTAKEEAMRKLTGQEVALAAYETEVGAAQARMLRVQRESRIQQEAYRKAYEHATRGGALGLGYYDPLFKKYYSQYRTEIGERVAEAGRGHMEMLRRTGRLPSAAYVTIPKEVDGEMVHVPVSEVYPPGVIRERLPADRGVVRVTPTGTEWIKEPPPRIITPEGYEPMPILPTREQVERAPFYQKIIKPIWKKIKEIRVPWVDKPVWGLGRETAEARIQELPSGERILVPTSVGLMKPTIKEVSEEEMATIRPGAAGFIRGEEIIVKEGREKTIAHEIGHYYTGGMLEKATSSQLKKLSIEGRVALGFKYRKAGIFPDIWGGVGGAREYAPEEYADEALAIAHSWMTSENPVKRATIELAMPETVQFIKKQLGSSNPGNPNAEEIARVALTTAVPTVPPEPPEARLMEEMGYVGVSTPLGVKYELPTGIPAPQVAPPTVAMLPPTPEERIKWAATEYYRRLFEDVPSYEPITLKKLAVEIPYGAYRAGRMAAMGVGEIAAGIAPPGVAAMPEQMILQRVTYAPPPRFDVPEELRPPRRIEEFRPSPVIPRMEIPHKEFARVTGRIGAGLGMLYAVPAPALTPLLVPAVAGKEIPPEERIEMGFLGAIGAGAIGLKGYRYAFGPRITYGAKPEPFFKIEKKPTDILVPITKKGRMIELGKFKITRVTPPREVMVTTRARQLLRRKPLVPMGPITPTRFDVAWTPDWMRIKEGVIKEPSFFVTKRIGAKFGTLFDVRGAQAPVTLAKFRQLPKTQQYALQKLVEKRLGRPVKLEFVPKMIKKTPELYRGVLEAEKVARIYPKPRELFLKRIAPGKRITRAETVSIIKKLPIPEEAPFEAFATLTGIKPTTKPFPRMAGKIEGIPGITVRMKPLEIPPPDIFRMKVAPVTKLVPPSPKGILALERAKVVAAKAMPRVAAPKILVPKPTMIKPAVIGITLKPTKKVEVPKITVIQPTKLIPKLKPVLIPRVGVKPLVKLKPRVALRPKEVLKVAAVPKVVTKVIPKTRVIPKVTTAPRLAERMMLKQRLISKVITTTPFVSKVVTTPRITPRIRVPPPTIKTKERRRRPPRRRPARKPALLFIPEIRRKGKWIPVTAPVPLLKAVAVGKKKVEKTLAVSLRIRGPKGIVPLTPFGPRWRRAKKELGVLIQKKYAIPSLGYRGRLTSPSEVSEILAAKKKKRGENLFFK